MEVLYISGMFDYTTYEKVFTQAVKPMHAANKYHTLLVKGLNTNGVKVNTYSVLPINAENCRKKYVRVLPVAEDGCKFSYMPILNIPVLRNLQAMVSAFFKTLFVKRDTVVVYDSLVVSASIGAVLAAKLSGKKTVTIVTDLPEFMPIAQSPKLLAINNWLMGAADGFIFLTEQMNPKINKNGCPHVIVEGLVDSAMEAKPHKSFTDQKKVLYAGSFDRIYGIGNLCHSFLACKLPNTQLHVYGDGNYAEELRQLADVHEELVYHGNVMNQEVVEAELDAALLVNPRPSEGEYTKYSFPSKTLEYMVSGTPVLTAKLPGIPEAYYDYLLFFEETEEGLEKALREILSWDARTLEALGEKSRRFALEEKNNVAQAKKVVELLEKLN